MREWFPCCTELHRFDGWDRPNAHMDARFSRIARFTVSLVGHHVAVGAA